LDITEHSVGTLLNTPFVSRKEMSKKYLTEMYFVCYNKNMG